MVAPGEAHVSSRRDDAGSRPSARSCGSPSGVDGCKCAQQVFRAPVPESSAHFVSLDPSTQDQETEWFRNHRGLSSQFRPSGENSREQRCEVTRAP
jgi:hypothetical protein